MIRDIMDLHTHTLASGHAYSTIVEMVQAAKEKNIELLGITEHGPAIVGSCKEIYFRNLKVVPRERDGIRVLFGVELNILDTEGHVDLPENLLPAMDVCVASLHVPCFAPTNTAEHTRAYLNVMKNPYVNIIGHPDDPRYPYDVKAVVESAKENHKLLELNNASLAPGSFRKATQENYLAFLELCKAYDQPVIMSSDAHVDTLVGDHTAVCELLELADFPQHLIINTSVDQVKGYVNAYR